MGYTTTCPICTGNDKTCPACDGTNEVYIMSTDARLHLDETRLKLQKELENRRYLVVKQQRVLFFWWRDIEIVHAYNTFDAAFIVSRAINSNAKSLNWQTIRAIVRELRD